MGYSDAARRFLDALDDGKRGIATAAFDDEAVRRDWHYIPRARPGLCLADMTAEQQKAAIDLLATGVSEQAFATACLVMALEDVLDQREQGSGPRRGAQRAWGRHRAEYHTIVFGDPAGDDPWGWRFEGHHVSVNVTIVDGELAATPQFLGANPMRVPGSYTLLRDEQSLAFALLDAMSGDERSVAIVADIAPGDILTTNATSVADALPPDEGIAIGDLAAPARAAAHELVAQYSRRLPTGTEPDVDADRLRFVFAGEPGVGRPHYYRLQGPHMLVEYDNTQDGANHVHTVVRAPSGDFGDDLLRRHRAAHHA